MKFTIDPKAAARIKTEAFKKEYNPQIRIGIRGGGCTGFSYLFEWYQDPAPEEYHVFEVDGASVIIDPKSMKYLNGTMLIFTSSLMGSGFELVNPNSKGTCGCGESVKF